MTLRFDPDRVRANVREADTADLLDRATIYRDGMQPEAVPIIEAELAGRGVTPQQIEDHAQRRGRDVLLHPDGLAATCSFCHQPATDEGWAWHRLWDRIPVFPRFFYYCPEHRPQPAEMKNEERRIENEE